MSVLLASIWRMRISAALLPSGPRPGEEGSAESGPQVRAAAAGTEVLRHRYGRINLQIGQVLTLSDLREDLGLPADLALSPAKRRALVTRLGNRVMDEINRVTAVTPGALTALVLLTHTRRGLPH